MGELLLPDIVGIGAIVLCTLIYRWIMRDLERRLNRAVFPLYDLCRQWRDGDSDSTIVPPVQHR